jgi:hypothetical protein
VTNHPRNLRNALVLAAGLYSPAAFAADVPIYDATQVAYGSYTIVKRVWVSTWRSAFLVGGSPSVEGARQAVVDEAARAGADAVVNLTCMDRTDSAVSPRGHYCYGDAVRTKR